MTNDKRDREGQQTPEDDAGPVQRQCQGPWDAVTAAFTSSPYSLQALCGSLEQQEHGEGAQVTLGKLHQGFSDTKVPPPLLPDYYFHNIKAFHHCLKLMGLSGEAQRFGTKGRRKKRHGRRDAAHITPSIPGRGTSWCTSPEATGSQPKIHVFPSSSIQAPLLPMFSKST